MPTENSKPKYHATKRQMVIASAEAMLLQVQVIDSKGIEQAIVVWKCGPQMFYADSIDGLFDVARRKPAPEWLMKQMRELPAERRFNSDGVPATEKNTGASKSVTAVPRHIPSNDTDLPEFAQS